MSWKLPTLKKLKLFLALGFAVTLLFVFLYGFTNWFAGHHGNVHSFYFNWELRIPLIPEMIFGYLSLNFLVSLVLFLMDEGQLVQFAKALAGATVLASIMFLIFPTRVGFDRSSQFEGYENLLGGLFAIDLPNNCFPSLHITYSFLTVVSLFGGVTLWIKAILAGWFVLICTSVVLVHQHHLADIMGGMALAWICHKIWMNER